MNGIRFDFPLLTRKFNNHDLIYFDNASTTQKPKVVLDAMTEFYSHTYANVHRGSYWLAEEATSAYEATRAAMAEYLGAQPKEIIFTKGTTEGINFIAYAWARKHLNPGDEIVLSELEHHANLLPWQRIARECNAQLKFIPVNKDGLLELDQLERIITAKTKLVAITHTSNAIGTHVDIGVIIDAARAVRAKILIDAAQSIPHQRLNTSKIDCDFLVFSAHKMLGPTGIGVLYIKEEIQDQVEPFQLGGGMVYEADFFSAKYNKPPHCYEAGTPPLAEAIGLHAALNYLKKMDLFALRAAEAKLCAQLIAGLQSIKKIRIIGPLEQLEKEGHMVTYVVDNIHAHDVAAFLSQRGICVRAGHHCAQSLARKLGFESSVRASFYCYNVEQEVNTLISAMDELITTWR